MKTANEMAWEEDIITICAEQDYQSIYTLMIEFAKYHVEEALKSASEKALVYLANDWIRKEETIYPNSLVDTIKIKVDKDSITNSYPLDNIQ